MTHEEGQMPHPPPPGPTPEQQAAAVERDAAGIYLTPVTFAEDTRLQIVEAVVEAMARRGVSRTELARRLGVSRSRVSHLLEGESIGVEMMGRIGEALGCRWQVALGDPVALAAYGDAIAAIASRVGEVVAGEPVPVACDLVVRGVDATMSAFEAMCDLKAAEGSRGDLYLAREAAVRYHDEAKVLRARVAELERALKINP
jgi:transcriptional regulator with XRE-family HTH domain